MRLDELRCVAHRAGREAGGKMMHGATAEPLVRAVVLLVRLAGRARHAHWSRLRHGWRMWRAQRRRHSGAGLVCAAPSRRLRRGSVAVERSGAPQWHQTAKERRDRQPLKPDRGQRERIARLKRCCTAALTSWGPEEIGLTIAREWGQAFEAEPNDTEQTDCFAKLVVGSEVEAGGNSRAPSFPQAGSGAWGLPYVVWTGGGTSKGNAGARRRSHSHFGSRFVS